MRTTAVREGFRTYEWEPRYSTSRDDLIGAFYEPAMSRAVSYDRAVGFFRSSFFAIAGSATARFAIRGGRIRMLCSPDLSAEDVDAIKRGLSLRSVMDEALQRELTQVLAHPLASPVVELLAALVAESVIEFRFGFRTTGAGMFHDKVGIFSDAHGDAVSFSGSINETWRGWHPYGNHESFEVFKSWSSGDADRVSDHIEYFESLWEGRADGVQVFEAPRAFRDRLITIASSREVRPSQVVVEERPRPRSLFDHQTLAIENWATAGYRGILQHATGSGKTITALHAIRDWLATGRPGLVLVPSTLLLQQWAREAARELAVLEPHILLVGGGNDEWREGSLLRVHTERGDAARLTIATIQTASTDRFVEAVRGGDHLLVVADEVHRLGGPKAQNVLRIESGGRLGISATPIRSGDPDGTAAILGYFGPVIPPIVSLRDAIAFGRLCRYEYHVHLVDLSTDETDQYKALTSKIGQALGALGGTEGSGYLNHLLIQRARIVKQAAAKASRASDIVIAGFADGQHWLVYCDDRRQVAEVLERLRQHRLDAFEYHSSMLGDRDATMERFRTFGGILVAIRCLDEGVDIPEVTHAVILASSKNTREFVQRRGRVLRTHPGKRMAQVHDLLVRPPPDPTKQERSRFASIAESEIARAAEFARDADNAATRTYLARLCIDWDIDPDALEEVESDED